MSEFENVSKEEDSSSQLPRSPEPKKPEPDAENADASESRGKQLSRKTKAVVGIIAAIVIIAIFGSLSGGSVEDQASNQPSTAQEQSEPENAVDKTALVSAIQSATSLDRTIYTDNTVSAVNDALSKANDVKGNDEATQDDVDNAAEALNDAVAALVVDPEKQAAAEEARLQREAEEAAKAQAAAEAKAKQQEINNATVSQKNALKKAQSYLGFSAFSYSGLVDQLEFEGFSTEDATWAVDHCGADWNKQAAKKAQSYLDFTSFSHAGLVEQLIFEGFTAEQAEYGVSATGL